MGELELQIFADRLKELRTLKRLTQAQFVDGLDITTSALSAYEKNLKNPSIYVVKKIAEKYDVSIDWLCGLSNSQKINTSIKIETYKDLIEYILLLSKCEGASYLEIEHWKLSIAFYDFTMEHFFSEYEKMLNLLEKNTIDKDVFDFWLEKTLNSYNKPLKPRKEKFFKNLLSPNDKKEKPLTSMSLIEEEKKENIDKRTEE